MIIQGRRAGGWLWIGLAFEFAEAALQTLYIAHNAGDFGVDYVTHPFKFAPGFEAFKAHLQQVADDRGVISIGKLCGRERHGVGVLDVFTWSLAFHAIAAPRLWPAAFQRACE